jgi:hypothetical protein
LNDSVRRTLEGADRDAGFGPSGYCLPDVGNAIGGEVHILLRAWRGKLFIHGLSHTDEPNFSLERLGKGGLDRHNRGGDQGEGKQ